MAFIPLLDRRLRGTAACLALSVTLAGCQTQGGLGGLVNTTGNSEPTYSIFYDQGDHLKELLAKSDGLSEADELYAKHKAFFVTANPEVKALVNTLAERRTAAQRPILTRAIGALGGFEGTISSSQWAEAREALQTGRSAVYQYPGSGVLNDPQFSLPEITELRGIVSRLENQFTSGAETAYRDHDHFAGDSFFDLYPVDLDKAQIAQANFDSVINDGSSLSTRAIKSYTESHGEADLGEDLWRRLGDIYLDAQMRESGASGSSDIPTILAAVNAAREAGFNPKSIPGLNISFVEVTSKTLLTQGQIDFPVSVDVDLPVDIKKADLDDALSPSSAEGSDILIVFDVALAKASRRVLNLKPVLSVLLAGYKPVENPEYKVVEQNVEVAKINFNSAQIRSSGYHGYGLAGAINSAFAGAAARTARDKLQEAMQTLASTPKTIDEPIYSRRRQRPSTNPSIRSITSKKRLSTPARP